MGTHPIFESDFDCLTEMNNCELGAPIPKKPKLCENESLEGPNLQKNQTNGQVKKSPLHDPQSPETLNLWSLTEACKKKSKQIRSYYKSAKCELCVQQFSCRSSLMLHIDRVHLQVVFKCPLCDFLGKRDHETQKHLAQVHNSSGFVFQDNFVPEKMTTLEEAEFLSAADQIIKSDTGAAPPSTVNQMYHQLKSAFFTGLRLNPITNPDVLYKLKYLKTKSFKSYRCIFCLTDLSLTDQYPKSKLVLHYKSHHLKIKYKCHECNHLSAKTNNCSKHILSYEQQTKTDFDIFSEVTEGDFAQMLTDIIEERRQGPAAHLIGVINGGLAFHVVSRNDLEKLKILKSKTFQSYNCIYCMKSHGPKSKLVMHYRTKHLKIKYKCSECDHISWKTNNCSKHILSYEVQKRTEFQLFSELPESEFGRVLDAILDSATQEERATVKSEKTDDFIVAHVETVKKEVANAETVKIEVIEED